MNIEDILTRQQLWVFGYGSILWSTGFTYASSEIGYVTGYKRRFWQGNITHRGTPKEPGRVATLIPDTKSVVWGAVYELRGETMVREALEHLGIRECKLGGYQLATLRFHPRHGSTIRTVHAFIAKPQNKYFLGSAGISDQACQIAFCRGSKGTNAEYVTRLAEFVRQFIPQDRDKHLFKLESAIVEILSTRDVRNETMEELESSTELVSSKPLSKTKRVPQLA